MSDYERDRQAGAQGRGWNEDTNMSAYYEGQANARLQAEEQQRRQQQHAHAWAQASGPRPEGGAGLFLLIPLVLVGILLFTMRLYALSLVGSILVAGLVLWGVMALLGEGREWRRPFAAVAQAYGLAILFAILAIGGAHALSRVGIDLTPGLEIFPPDGGEPQVAGVLAVAFPLLAGLAAATFWLSYRLPATSFPRVLRWGGLALVLTLAPLVGVRLARMVLGFF